VSNAKTEAVELIKKLPDDATLEDIQHHLFVLEKIKQGQQRLVSEGSIPQAVMEDHAALARAHELDSGNVMPKTQAEVFHKARAALG
jgi:hypothetical protein